jgi:flagellar hook-associated protein 2
MAGVQSSVGIFSGINTADVINQLLAIDAVPAQQAQQRVLQLQQQQAAYLDINSRLSALKDAAAAFRLNSIFQTKSATSSSTDTLSATADTTAAPGTYTFLVDRLVTTQQLLSTGFANKDSSAMGATSFTFESTQARLDKDVALTDLNGGQGVSRGKIVVTDSAGHASTIDLSRTLTINEVIDAINNNGTAQVSASIQGSKLVINDHAGGAGTMQITDAAGYSTATSLGIAGTATGTTLTGSNVYTLASTTPLSVLNDGNGISIHNSVGTGAYSFLINVGGATPTSVHVNLGDVYTQDSSNNLTKTEGAVTTVGGVITRINAALSAAGVNGVTASIDANNGRLTITDSTGTQPLTVTENGDTTAADLGLTTTPVSGSIQGRRVLAGLNTTLARGLNGGSGISGDGVLNFTAKDGTAFSVTVDPNASLNDIFNQIQTASGAGANGRPRISVSLDSRGTGIQVTDNTGGGGNLIITGTSGQDSAASMGISTGAAGTTDSGKASGNLQRQYITRATQLSSLNSGRGIGTGTFRITDSTGASATVDIESDSTTLDDVINEINSRPDVHVHARINDHGDGIEVDDTSSPAGTLNLKIEDVTGTVASALNIAGTSTGTGAANKIDGSYERTVTFSAADTLQTVADKINAAKVGVSAAIIQDGSATAPFRLNLTSTGTGEAGRFIVDSGGLDLGFQTLDAGNNARVFFGSSDPARALAVTSSTNTVDQVIPGVKVDLVAPNVNPVTLTVASDTTTIENSVKEFIDAFNTTVTHIDQQTSYNADTNQGGTLLSDSTTLQLRSTLFDTLNSPAVAITSQFTHLADVGITVGQDGTLSLDDNHFRAALSTDPNGVEALFEAHVPVDDSQINLGGGVTVNNPNAGDSFSSLGVMGLFEQMATRYVDSVNGVLTIQSQGLDDQIKLQNSRIADINSMLDDKRTMLEEQFNAMEEAIGKLQTQQSALTSIIKA